jgi:hypothetical protein
MQVQRLGGFCLLVRRAVLDRVESALDEWTDLGRFDTDILSAKAHQRASRPCAGGTVSRDRS